MTKSPPGWTFPSAQCIKLSNTTKNTILLFLSPALAVHPQLMHKLSTGSYRQSAGVVSSHIWQLQIAWAISAHMWFRGSRTVQATIIVLPLPSHVSRVPQLINGLNRQTQMKEGTGMRLYGQMRSILTPGSAQDA